TQICARLCICYQRAVCPCYSTGNGGSRINDKPMPRLGGCVAVDHTPDEKVFIRLILKTHFIRGEQCGRKSDGKPSPIVPVFAPLLRIIFVSAEAEQIKFKPGSDGIVVQ